MASEFDGTEVLELMSEHGKLEEFLLAIDSDDFSQVKSLMSSIGCDDNLIDWVLCEMEEGS